jgi:4-amino-4-deoxy-L-arabinose transferase-like glycosyltransferase
MRRLPIAWLPLILLMVVKLVVHAVASGPLAWGYMTDELYFLDSVDRLQWGYVDHPPLSVALLRVWRDLFGSALFAIRIPAWLCGCATILLSGLLARELGGGRAAQGIAALGALATPVYFSMGNYYSMNPIEQALWAGAFVLLARLGNGGSGRLWVWLGVLLGVAMLNKVSTAWLAAGIAAGVVLTPLRSWLWTPWPWVGAAIAVAGALPYAAWNAANGWPFLEFSRNAASEKVGHVSLLDFVVMQLIVMGYTPAPAWIAGLVYVLVGRPLRHQRALGWTFVVVAAILAASGSARPHYLAPAFPVAFAGCGVLLERWSRRWRWLPAAAAFGTAAMMVVSLPLAIPVLSPAATIRYQDALGLTPPVERERGGALPMHLGLYLHAEAVLGPLQRAFEALPAEDRQRVELLTTAFGETGAVNVLGAARGLPRSLGRHNQYGLWGPGDASGALMLVESDDPAQLRDWFEVCDLVADIDCPNCMEQLDAQAIYLCRRARQPLAVLWSQIRMYR